MGLNFSNEYNALTIGGIECNFQVINMIAKDTKIYYIFTLTKVFVIDVRNYEPFGQSNEYQSYKVDYELVEDKIILIDNRASSGGVGIRITINKINKLVTPTCHNHIFLQKLQKMIVENN